MSVFLTGYTLPVNIFMHFYITFDFYKKFFCVIIKI